MLNVLHFQQTLSFGHSSNYRYNSATKTEISAVTWQTFHEHILADEFRS